MFHSQIPNRYLVINGNDEVVITDCSDTIDKSTISIPDKIDGHPVTMIYYYVFSGLENTKTINIPDSVKVIGAEAISYYNFIIIIYYIKNSVLF